MSTAVFLEEFKGYPIFAIYKVGKNGRKIGFKPTISFGATKAKAILAHLEELKEWVETQVDEDDEDEAPYVPQAKAKAVATAVTVAKTVPKIIVRAPAKVQASSENVIKVDLSNMSADKQQAFALLFGGSANNDAE